MSEAMPRNAQNDLCWFCGEEIEDPPEVIGRYRANGRLLVHRRCHGGGDGLERDDRAANAGPDPDSIHPLWSGIQAGHNGSLESAEREIEERSVELLRLALRGYFGDDARVVVMGITAMLEDR